MKKYFAEFFGTFLLVLFGTGSVVLSQSGFHFVNHLVISFSFGISVFLMIVLFGKLSGSHINPAVTICLAIDNKFKWKDVLPYCIFQLIGAIAASFVLKILFPENSFLGSTLPSGSSSQSFFIEILLMFILMLTILNSGSKLIFSAFIIGTVVGLEAYFAGPITGASMNPARSIGPALVSGHLEHLWIYILAPVVGGVLAIVSSRTLKKLK
ncbi:MAG: aquaporin [Bacteroidota bacterium]|nr:aquaporin [Bacteroidota bacterium]MDP3145444.1 aquaporin [Bacteroidota bacterium]